MNSDFTKVRRFSARLLLVLLGFGLPFGALEAHAQLSSASVNGTVRDSTGAVINGAQITLRDISSGTERAAASNSSGTYAFINVATTS